MSRCYETEQNNPHHIYNVGEHIDAVVSHIPTDMKDDEILVMAAMLHDIGKPDVKETKADGTDRFVGHAKRSAEVSAPILDEIGLGEEESKQILWIIEHHEIGDPVKAKTMKKWLKETTKEIIAKLFVLRYADIEGQSEYQKSQKLAVVRQNLETLSTVLEEEGESDDIVNALLRKEV
jgi:tRNA nucleotidyltransferase (CCA-adding enzyme)